jgi:hypothetical protein
MNAGPSIAPTAQNVIDGVAAAAFTVVSRRRRPRASHCRCPRGNGSGRSVLTANLANACLRSADAFAQSVAEWKSPHGKLEVTTMRNVGTVNFMDGMFRSQIDGRPVPMMRLSNAHLV